MKEDPNHKESCATCRAEVEAAQITADNEKFDNQLWTFIAVNNETGEESVLYGHATNNVYIYALAQADHENSWLKTVKYIKPEPLSSCSDEYYDYYAGDTGLFG